MALTNRLRAECNTAPLTAPLLEKGEVPTAVRIEGGRAVWANDAEVFQAMIISLPVDVIEDQRHALSPPQLTLSTEFAAPRFEP
jgi:hypothetical protein